MAAEVIRFKDYERRKADADAVGVRDPADSAIIIILPVIRVDRTLELEKPKPTRKSR